MANSPLYWFVTGRTTEPHMGGKKRKREKNNSSLKLEKSIVIICQ